MRSHLNDLSAIFLALMAKSNSTSKLLIFLNGAFDKQRHSEDHNEQVISNL